MALVIVVLSKIKGGAKAEAEAVLMTASVILYSMVLYAYFIKVKERLINKKVEPLRLRTLFHSSGTSPLRTVHLVPKML